jgi:hypothetical protein
MRYLLTLCSLLVALATSDLLAQTGQTVPPPPAHAAAIVGHIGGMFQQLRRGGNELSEFVCPVCSFDCPRGGMHQCLHHTTTRLQARLQSVDACFIRGDGSQRREPIGECPTAESIGLGTWAPRTMPDFG